MPISFTSAFYSFLLVLVLSVLPRPNGIHSMYDNPEQLSLTEALIEHWDKYLSRLLQFILPENVSSSASIGVDTLTREYALAYPR